ncbi:hypothetical protein IG631_22570 [Alternaria alternata]|nr:hypothetical protein IG631_22570 [Alternaria alternata]
MSCVLFCDWTARWPDVCPSGRGGKINGAALKPGRSPQVSAGSSAVGIWFRGRGGRVLERKRKSELGGFPGGPEGVNGSQSSGRTEFSRKRKCQTFRKLGEEQEYQLLNDTSEESRIREIAVIRALADVQTKSDATIATYKAIETALIQEIRDLKAKIRKLEAQDNSRPICLRSPHGGIPRRECP